MRRALAACEQNEVISLDQIIACYGQLAAQNMNVVVEGVGGWRVPISENISTVDIVRDLDLPVIMVVGIRLGCINHAILTAEAIRSDGVNLCGWVSNQLEKDHLFIRETNNTLKERLACPRIADIPYMSNFEPDKILERIDLSLIFRV